MTVSTFLKLDPEQSQAVLADINPAVEGGIFDPQTVTVLAQELSFYPGYRFLEVSDYSATPTLQRHVVHAPGIAIILNGTNEPIYRMNKLVPIRLQADNVTAYARFFFAYVRGRHGRFLLAETVDDLTWKEEPAAATRKTIGQLLTPLQLVGHNAEDGSFRLSACLLFKEALFKAQITVKPDGQVTLANEEVLLEDLPVLDDTLGQ